MISFVVPVYRSAESLPELHRGITAVFGEGNQALEIIFVEDCGGDDFWSFIQ
jgi:undecaprenyl-phosphate 4-deoxy-4-formamido-L-arabinose transferase